MATSLAEVIEGGGYDLAQPDDAKWLISKQQEFADLVEFAENVIEESEAEDEPQ